MSYGTRRFNAIFTRDLQYSSLWAEFYLRADTEDDLQRILYNFHLSCLKEWMLASHLCHKSEFNDHPLFIMEAYAQDNNFLTLLVLLNGVTFIHEKLPNLSTFMVGYQSHKLVKNSSLTRGRTCGASCSSRYNQEALNHVSN